MPRFQETLENLKAMASHMPSAMAAASIKPGGPANANVADLERALIDLFQREDSTSVRICLLIEKISSKYKGRAV